MPFELSKIADEERFAAPAELGVFARNFGVVQLHGVRRAAAKRDRGAVESEASALIAALDHKQRRHDEIPVGKPAIRCGRRSVFEELSRPPFTRRPAGHLFYG